MKLPRRRDFFVNRFLSDKFFFFFIDTDLLRLFYYFIDFLCCFLFSSSLILTLIYIIFLLCLLLVSFALLSLVLRVNIHCSNVLAKSVLIYQISFCQVFNIISPLASQISGCCCEDPSTYNTCNFQLT